MTREQNFFQSFTTQLVAYTGWQNIPRYDLKRLPLSSFPAFSLELGKTTYTKLDPTGKAITGEQDFHVTVSYLLPHENEIPVPGHSDITNLIELFINNSVYMPPAVLPGDSYAINRAALTDTKAMIIPFEESRFQVVASGKYLFTIF